jgi:uncharacterized protein
MNKERFYKGLTVILLALVLALGLVIILKRAPQKSPRAPVGRTAKPSQAAGRIAIVIDDVGYSLANISIIENIQSPLTFSVLPGLAFSQSAAAELNSRGFQVILHLPMEPKEPTKLENDTILTSMDETQVKSITEKDLADIPGVRGISNHMGSKVTEDEKTLSAVFDVLNNKQLFFLDSFVTAKSVARQTAKNKRIKFAQRDVFLDNTPDPDYIRRQITQLKQKSRLKGVAVGIGHDRKITLEVLKEEIPKMKKEGFKFVFVSELAR